MKTQNIKIQIRKVDARKAKEYYDNNECLLCQAVRRQMRITGPRFAINAGPTSVVINNRNFSLSTTACRKIIRSYAKGEGRFFTRKRIKQPFKPFTVLLRPV